MESGGPKRAGLVLAALILVAAVANLNLAVANVALPDIGKAFDASQTTLNLVAVGYSLGLAASVLYLGALGDRYGRKMMLILGMALVDPGVAARRLRAHRSASSSPPALLGGVAAGMAYPTTLALITALWSGAGRTKCDRALVGASAARSPSLGPLLSGRAAASTSTGARSSCVTLPLAVVALVHGLAASFPPTSTRRPSRSTTSAASSRCVLVGGARPGDQLRAGAEQGRRWRSGSAIVALAAVVAFVHPPAPGAEPALRPRRRRPAHLLGGGLRRDHRLRLADGRDVHRPAVPPERARLLDPRRRRWRSCRRRSLMVLVAPRSAKLVEARGARFTLLVGYVFCLLGFLTMLLLWKEDIAYWKVGLGYALRRHRRRLRRHARLALADRLGAGAAGRAWRRAPPTCSATSAARSCSRSSARC